MKSERIEKLTVYVIVLLFIALFSGEISTMLKIATHECQGGGCIEIVDGE